MTYKVIQWMTGGVGRAALQGILGHPELELVGCLVHSESKDGVDVGEFIDAQATGVKATRDTDALLELDADCVLYAPLMANPQEIERLLRAGLNVVTPTGWFFADDSDTNKTLRQAAEAGGASLHGTGIHPGGVTDKLPLILSALTGDITHVRSEEFSDIRTYDAPEVCKEIMLFGKTEEEIKNSMMVAFLGDGFGQSIRMIAAAMQVQLDAELKSTHEYALATAPITDAPFGTIEIGQVAAQRFTWQGTVNGEPVITARVNWLMGEDHLDKDWRFGEKGERFEMEVKGDPDVDLVLHGAHPPSIEAGLVRNEGIVVTARHCVNSIPAVCEAKAGIVSYLDLPLIAGRFKQ